MNKYKIIDNLSAIIGFPFCRKHEIPVIYYHSIVNSGGKSYSHTDFEVFKRHMKYLIDNNYETLLFNEVSESFRKKTNKKCVIIAFDDGFKDNYTLIFDYMKENKLKYNIFLIGSKIGIDSNYLSWEDVEVMYKSGLVDFGAHTYSHIDCRQINSDNLVKEIEETNALIEEHTKNPVTDFCFPYGYYNQNVIDFFAEHTPYKKLYTSNYMPVNIIKNHSFRGRIPLRNEDNIKVFEHKLKGYYNFMYYLKYKKEAK